MRLKTIWFGLYGAKLSERVEHTLDWLAIFVASHLLPKRIAYWSYIKMGTGMLRSDEAVIDAKFATLLDRMWRPGGFTK